MDYAENGITDLILKFIKTILKKLAVKRHISAFEHKSKIFVAQSENKENYFIISKIYVSLKETMIFNNLMQGNFADNEL
jgi:hypothetical protein